MAGNLKKAVLECGCCGVFFCPCCPGWPERASASIAWTSRVTVINDCGDSGEEFVTGDFSCQDTGDPLGVAIRLRGTFLNVRVFCDLDPLTGGFTWRAQYRSAVSGTGFEPPISATWADAEDFLFSCPDCADAVNGQATGFFMFTAFMGCETSGGIVVYPVEVEGLVTLGCP